MGRKPGGKNKPKNKVNRKVNVSIEPEKKVHSNVDTEKSIKEKLTETKKATEQITNEPLSKGTSMEEKIIASMNPEENTNDSSTSQDENTTGENTTGEKKKRKPYTKRNRSEFDQHDEKKIDQIATMVNVTLAPIIAYKFNKEVKDCMYTKEQMDEMIKLQPPSRLDEPSWISYGLTAIAIFAYNCMQANKKVKEETTEQINHETTFEQSNTRSYREPVIIDITEDL